MFKILFLLSFVLFCFLLFLSLGDTAAERFVLIDVGHQNGYQCCSSETTKIGYAVTRRNGFPFVVSTSSFRSGSCINGSSSTSSSICCGDGRIVAVGGVVVLPKQFPGVLHLFRLHRAESFHATIVTIIHEIPNGIKARNVRAGILFYIYYIIYLKNKINESENVRKCHENNEELKKPNKHQHNISYLCHTIINLPKLQQGRSVQ